MAEEIKIVASAVGFDQVNKALSTTASGMSAVSTEAKKTADTLSKELKNGSGQAAQSITNLSRIAQDAPYGFIGITNNINPLIESFGRLKTETGSTGGALKALVSGLSGPAGLGLAVGVITSAITLAQIGFDRWTGSTKKTAEAVDEAKKAMDSIYSGLGQEATQVNSLIAVLDNETESRSRKLQALKELKSINPEIFGQLDIENNKVTGLSATYDAYIKSLTNVVAAKILQGKLEKELTKLVELQGTTLTSSEKAAANFGKTIQQGIINNLKSLGGEAANAALNLEKIQSSVAAKKQENIRQTANRVQELREELAKVSSGIKLPELKADKIKDPADKAKKALESFDQTIIKTLGDLQDQQQISIAIDKSTLDEQIKIVTAEIARGIKEFNLPSNDQRIIVLAAKLDELQAQKDIENLDLNIKIPKVDISLPDEKELMKKMSDFQSILNQFASDSAAQVGTILGEGLYAAITGQNDGLAAAFGGLFSLFGDAVVSLGKYAIMYSSAMEALKKAIAGASGIAGIGIGIGLIALGTLIKKATSGIGKSGGFAVGTRNAPGGLALVGERGPELVNLAKGSQVIPAAQTSNMLGAMQSIEVYGMLKGKDIYFSNKNYSSIHRQTT